MSNEPGDDGTHTARNPDFAALLVFNVVAFLFSVVMCVLALSKLGYQGECGGMAVVAVLTLAVGKFDGVLLLVTVVVCVRRTAGCLRGGD